MASITYGSLLEMVASIYLLPCTILCIYLYLILLFSFLFVPIFELVHNFKREFRS